MNTRLKSVSRSFQYKEWRFSCPVLHLFFAHFEQFSRRLSDFKRSYLSQMTTETLNQFYFFSSNERHK